jgi:hypothetical protein
MVKATEFILVSVVVALHAPIGLTFTPTKSDQRKFRHLYTEPPSSRQSKPFVIEAKHWISTYLFFFV